MHNTKNSYLSLPPEESNREWRSSAPSDERADLRVPGAPASGRIVLLSVVMLGAIGAGGFLFMYNSVHADDAKNLGALERQAAPPVETSVALTPATPLQSATPTIAAAALTPARVAPAPRVAPMPLAAASAPGGAAPTSARPPAVVIPARPQVRTPPVTHHVRTRSVDTTPPVDSSAREPAQATGPVAPDSDANDDAPAKPAATGEDLFDSRK